MAIKAIQRNNFIKRNEERNDFYVLFIFILLLILNISIFAEEI